MRVILLTGATGVLGSALVPTLLGDPNVQLRLLIRAHSDDHLRQRVEGLYAFWGSEVDRPTAEARIQVFRCDVLQPQLGLTDSVYSRLTQEVTHVIHSAGNVRLNQTLPAARRDAVDSLGHIIAFCHACQLCGSFQKLDHVSTVGVAGKMPGLIPERPLAEPREFHNTYEQAKAEAEDLLLTEMQGGLPATIHRPSMIVGDSRTGKLIRNQVFHYICKFLTGRETFGIVPNLSDAILDVLPVDWAAKAVAVASQDTRTAGQVMHLCSGANAIQLGELAQEVQRQSSKGVGKVRTIRQVPLGAFLLACRASDFCLTGRPKRVVGSILQLLRYLETRQQFSNRLTSAYLAQYGIDLNDRRNIQISRLVAQAI